MVTSRKKTVEIEAVLDDKASPKLKKMGDDAQKSSKGFSGLSAGMKLAAASGVALAAGKVVDFLADATANALADEAAQKQLALAVQNTTGATGHQLDAIDDYINKTQAATGITDDQLRPAMANLVRATKDVGEAQDLMGVAMDIATARGLPLEAVTLAIAKAAQGNVGALGKMGISVRDAEGKFKSFEDVIADAGQTFAGATDEMAESAEGKMKRAAIAFDEVKETIGSFLIPAVAEASGVFADMVGSADLLLGKLDELSKQGQGVPGVADAAITMIPIIGQLYTGFRNFGTAIEGVHEWLLREEEAQANATYGWEVAEGVLAGYNRRAIEAQGGQEELEGQLDKTRTAQKSLTDETLTYLDVLKASTDPVFAAIDAADNLRTAQDNLKAVTDDTEASASDLAEAELAVAEGLIDAQGAMDDLSPAQLNSAIDTIAIALGKPQAEVATLLEQLGVLDGKTVTTYIDLQTRILAAIRMSDRPVEQRHSGGHVPGVAGTEVPILARAGEFVSQGGTPAHSNGHSPMIVQVNVDGKKFIEELVVPQLARYSRRNGGLGL